MVGCAAVGCSSSSTKGKKMFRFPWSEEKKMKWVVAVRRATVSGSLWIPSVGARVCQDHFVTGAPSKDPHHVDYVPSIFWHDERATEASRRKRERYHRHTALTEKRTAAVQHAAGAGIHPVTCVTQQPTAAGYHASGTAEESRDTAVVSDSNCNDTQGASVSEDEDIAPVEENDASGTSFDEALADFNCNNTQGASVSEDEDIAPVEENDASGTSFDEAVADFNCNDTQGASVSEDEDIAPVEENDASGTSFDEAVAART
ncbi:uncharacterized protein LOC125945073 [Dermacentor silvarum]|uniref:uncharacterized protein LOC125945073 n=1 Tax=Dermacentor silvarum TaxID=543639 RepID=UPI0021013282|nr:uncharacterized protein LOC125945073 [Dermacentor silvarum]